MTKEEWIQLIKRAANMFQTPFFLFSHLPIETQLNLIKKVCGSSAFNWLSVKTLTLRNLLCWWLSTNLGVEVVSEFELLAALQEGFSPERIIVNGVGKHFWNQSSWTNGLRVNFDSIKEVEYLSSIAKRREWKVGIRFHPSIQKDPENPQFPDQFGLPAESFLQAINLLNQEQINLESVHIHLRSNVPNLDFFQEALRELESCVKRANIELRCLDLGGGLPAEGEKQQDQVWHSTFCLHDLDRLLHLCHKMFPTVQEYILENGRFLLSGCGVLVLSVIDIKEIGGFRYIICDGGRTNHALPSDWQVHEIVTIPNRTGEVRNSAICGPTCMAFDCLIRKKLPNDLSLGDKVIWFNAGAYHLSWETRFSQPLARVLWHDEQNQIVEARAPESFKEWWGRWR